MRNKIIISLVFFMNLSYSFGQQKLETPLALVGPKGVLISLIDNGYTHFNSDEHFVISKSVGKTEKFKELTIIGFPKSAEEFQKHLGQDWIVDLKEAFEIADTQALYNKIVNQPVDSLGLYVMDEDFSQLLGMVYIDKSWKVQDKAIYRIEKFKNKDKVSEYFINVDGRYTDYSERFEIVNSSIDDSTVIVNWNYPKDQINLESLYVNAVVYRDKDNVGFKPVDTLFLSPSAIDIGVMAYFTENITEGSTYAYYMKINDWVGNLGVASDTLFGLAYDPNKIDYIAGLESEDHTRGVKLKWDPLPDRSIYTGIEILKSRNTDSEYVVLDTIEASETTYLDTRVLKGTSYFYKVKPLFLNHSDAEFIKYSEIIGTHFYKEDNTPPLLPQGLEVSAIDKGIRVSWWSPDELDIFGYFVLRGKSRDNMEVISDLIEDTFYIDTLQMDGFSGQYLYAIQAINHNQQLSDTSDLVVADIRQPSYVTAPAGLAARKVVEGIALTWNNVKEVDDNVVAYVVFRKEVGEVGEYKVIHDNPISMPYYIDSTYTENAALEYAVSSLDIWGNFSNLSPIATVDVREDYELLPPLELSLRNLGSGIEVSWPTSLTEKKGIYIIYRKEEGKSDYSKIGEADIRKVFIDRNVTKDVAYEYRVQHAFENKESDPSLSKELRR